jgi:prefoldin alpha subunit
LELQSLELSLDELKNVRKGQEILAPFGKGLFLSCRLESTESLLVDVGAKTLVNKKIEEVKGFLSGQKEKIRALREKLSQEITKALERMSELEQELRAGT